MPNDIDVLRGVREQVGLLLTAHPVLFPQRVIAGYARYRAMAADQRARYQKDRSAQHPARLTWDQLRRLPASDCLALAYAHLGMLWSVQSADPIITDPQLKGDPANPDERLEHTDYRSISPVVFSAVTISPPQLVPDRLPPDTARALLDLVRADLAAVAAAPGSIGATNSEERLTQISQQRNRPSGALDVSLNAVRSRFYDLGQRFNALGKEWGGTRLLLRVIPGPHGRLTDGPPFDTEVRHLELPHPGEYPITVLRVQSRLYIEAGAQSTFGLACEGQAPRSSTARWGLFWLEHRLGWEHVRALAKEAGELLLALPDAARARLQFYGLDPCAVADPVERWLLALFGVALSWDPTPQTTANIVTHNHQWIPVPANRAERDALARAHGSTIADSLQREPLDNLAVLLGLDAFAASSSACSTVRGSITPVYSWDPPAGADPGESTGDRIARILLTLLEAREKSTGDPGMVRWRTMPGVTRSDFAYLIEQRWVESGCDSTWIDPDRLDDPEYTDVWLSAAGMERALQVRQSHSGSGTVGAISEPKWLTVTEAHVVSGLPTYEISRLVKAGKLGSNGKSGYERRIIADSLIELKLAIAKEKTLKKLRKHVR